MVPTRYAGDVSAPEKGFRRALTPFSCPAGIQGSLEEVRGQKGDRHPDIRGKAALSPTLVIPHQLLPRPYPLVSFSFRWALQESLLVLLWFVHLHSSTSSFKN